MDFLLQTSFWTDISDWAVQHCSAASYTCQAALESNFSVASVAHHDTRDGDPNCGGLQEAFDM